MTGAISRADDIALRMRLQGAFIAVRHRNLERIYQCPYVSLRAVDAVGYRLQVSYSRIGIHHESCARYDSCQEEHAVTCPKVKIPTRENGADGRRRDDPAHPGGVGHSSLNPRAEVGDGSIWPAGRPAGRLAGWLAGW